jgi:hypothetical protein
LRTGRFRGAAALLLALALAGVASCSWVPFVGNKAPEAAAAAACPVAVVLRPLANTAVFTQSGGDLKPLGVTWYGIFSDTSATCNLGGDTLRASLDNIIVAERGPAARGNDVDFQYFVALTTGNQTILAKKSFAVHVSVPDRAKRGGVSDHVEVAFATGGRPLSDLAIQVGFQESPDAIEFYKHFRGR